MSWRARWAALGCLLGGCAAAAPRSDEPMVDIRSAAPAIVVDIRYSTPDNFAKTAFYPANRCVLRRSVAERLAAVEADLAARGLGLKVWDCYRPLSVQRKLWALVPDPRYVADPKKGSRHNRGAAVDATLVDASGRELEMPTGYDDFSQRAHRGDPSSAPQARTNSRLLEDAMRRRGFVGLDTEWWHFDAEDWRKFPLSDAPFPA